MALKPKPEIPDDPLDALAGVGIDHGEVMGLTSAEVNDLVDRARLTGTLLLAVYLCDEGIAIQSFMPPSDQMAQVLDMAAAHYRTAMAEYRRRQPPPH